MVEVWLPYRDTELPIMLPDPIDLKIAPKTVVPEAKEFNSLERLHKLLSKIPDVKIAYNPFSLYVERNYIDSVLSKAEIEYEVTDYNEANVCIDIFRYDPILGFKSSIWTNYLSNNPIESVLKVLNSKNPNPLDFFKTEDEKIYIDLIIDGGPRVVNIFFSKDASHYSEALKFYKNRWCLKSEVSPLVIASVGGVPWDTSFYLVILSLIKMFEIMVDGGLGILIGDSVLKDIDPTRIVDLNIESIKDIGEVYLYYFFNKVDRNRANVVYYGSIPNTITKMFGLRKIRDVEAYLKSVPRKSQRDILVVEDMTFLYPVRCERVRE